MAAGQVRGETIAPPVPTTALGALFDHILGGHIAAEGEPGPRSFQPMNVNFGLLPPVTVAKPEGLVGRWKSTEKALAKRKAMSDRALADIRAWA
jgi:methylenetetrahydrofolate--tRNA-(uracil-5-)-methyltransferase